MPARLMVLSLSTIMLGIFYLILRVNCGILASCLSVFISLNLSSLYYPINDNVAGVARTFFSNLKYFYHI
jgi:hypothetical protein